MKMGKRIGAALTAALLVATMAACGNGGAASSGSASGGTSGATAAGGKTKLRVFLGGGETVDQIDAIIKKFNAQSNSIELENVKIASNQTGYQMLTVMYNAGNVPTLVYLESNDLLKIKDKLADLSDMKEVQTAAAGTLDDVKADGKIYGLPTNIQGYGLMYSRSVLDDTMGKDFDPKTIKTRADFEKVCQQIQAKGVAPVVISPFNWSLANHYLDQVYSGQSADAAGRDAFVAKLKSGTANLAGNKVYNDYMDTFDIMKKYNYYKSNPLETDATNTVDTEAQVITSGKAAFWFMGNWAAPSIRTLDESGDYGYIPVPLGDQSSPNFGKICTLVPGYYGIDKALSTPQQQKAAREVIDYLLTSNDGKDYTVNQCKFIPAYTDNTLKITESLAASVSQYSSEKNAFPMYTKYPSDHFDVLGVPMQKYLTGQLDRAGLAKQIEGYWQKQK